MPSAKRPIYTAKVVSLAEANPSQTENSSLLEEHIRQRIQKLLARANGRGAARDEAETAMRLARRYMAQYNVTQADVVAEANDSGNGAKLGGHSTVRITRADDDSKRVVQLGWVDEATDAMEVFFDCKCYFTTFPFRDKVEWTFYGIAANTVAAAMAFETVHNLILDWSITRAKGNKYSYCWGAAHGLMNIAWHEKEQEERRTKHLEETGQADGHVSQSMPEASVTWDDSDNPDDSDDSDGLDFPSDFPDFGDLKDEEADLMDTIKMEPEEQADEPVLDPAADFEEEFGRNLDQYSERIKKEENGPSENGESVPWKSHQALIRFQHNAATIADEYLKSTQGKVGNARRATCKVQDYDAYFQGREHSKEIDIKRKRIEEGKNNVNGGAKRIKFE